MSTNPDLKHDLVRENARLRARVRELEAATPSNPPIRSLESLRAHVSDAVIATDALERVTYFNRVAESQYGIERKAALGQPLSAIYQTQWLEADGPELCRQALKRGQSWRSKCRHLSTHGQEIVVEITHHPLPENGESEGEVLRIIRDITLQTKAQIALSQSEERLRLALEASEMGLWEWNAHTDIIDSTARHRQLHGLPAVPHAGLYAEFQARIDPEDLPRIQAGWELAAQNGSHWTIEYRAIWPDGSVHWLLSRSKLYRDADGQPERMLGTTVDFTERKRAEAALRENVERQALVLRSLPMAFYSADPGAASTLWVSENIESIFGFPPSAFIGSSLWRERLHPEDLAATLKQIRATTVKDGFQAEYRWLHSDGNYRWFLDQGTSTTTSNGRMRIIGTALDITERKQAEVTLRKSQETVSLAIRGANLGTWDWDLQSGTLLFSERCKTMLGIPNQAQMSYSLLQKAIHPDDRTHTHHALRLALELKTDFWPEHRTIWPDGSVHWIACHGRCFYDSQGKAIRMTGITQDITARKQAENQLHHLNSELEKRVIERTLALQTTNQELENEMAARLRLEHEILEISEREQCRLGQDLHDGLGQELAGISLLVKVHADRLAQEGHKESQTAADLAISTSDTIETARNLARGLYPVELNRYGLQIALEDLAYQTQRRFQITCEVRNHAKQLTFPKAAEIHLYRIAQECINNAFHHGEATAIVIECFGGRTTPRFKITDNGKGYEQPPSDHPGMGLRLMQYRARLIGAQILFTTNPLGGCVVDCQFALP